MKNFTKILLISSVINSFGIHNSYGMSDEYKDKESGHFTNKLKYAERGDVNSSFVPSSVVAGTPSMIALDVEEGVSEETIIQTVSMGTRIKGYGIRCSAIACATLIGGSIGFGIMIGELDLGIAYQLVKGTTPVLLGSLIGYTVGWIFGNTIKAKITGRC